MILEQDKPDDFVCATGISHSVRELCDYTFSRLDLDYKDYVGVDKRFYRAEGLVHLKGDSSKLKSIGFEVDYTFETMLDEMIDYWEIIYR